MYFQEQGNFGNLKPRERSSIFLESLRSKSRRTNPSKFLSYLRRNFRLPFEITVPRLYHWHSFLPRYPTIDLIALRLFLKKKERRNPNKRLNVICQIENLDKVGHVATNKKPRPGSFQLVRGGPWIDNVDLSIDRVPDERFIILCRNVYRLLLTSCYFSARPQKKKGGARFPW